MGKKERIYFVIPESHRIKWSAQVSKSVEEGCRGEELAGAITDGIDSWILQTWMKLKEYEDEPYEFELVRRGVKGAISVYHNDHAKREHGVLESYSIVVQADRPAPLYADMCVVQNPTQRNGHLIHLWGQPGLIRRDEGRGTRVEVIGIPGSRQYVPRCIEEEWFKSELRGMGIEVRILDKGNWSDYSGIDIIVGWRPGVKERVLRTKPASKLLNAWKAGTPALLGREPAYRAIREHEDDYYEIEKAEDILRWSRKLQENPEIYARIVRHYKERAKQVSEEKIVESWFRLFKEAEKSKNQKSKVFWKGLRYNVAKVQTMVLKRSGLWRD